jgi:fermentation-respiration switch protein FrsA (DUF1100 family)
VRAGYAVRMRRGVTVIRRHVAAAALLLLSLIACGDEASTASSGPFAVGTRSLTWVDDSRPTPAYGDQPEQPARQIVTDVWYPADGDPAAPPAADAPPADGPFPVIVFNHGQQGEPQQYALSFETWTRAGYVVVAPRHPLTIRGGPGALFVDDIQGELGDVPFVIDRVEDELSDIADVDHLAVAGHSSGAIVARGVGLNTCCHDDRVDAVLLEALIPIELDGEYSADLADTPMMLLHGTEDREYPLDVAHQVFDAAQPPKVFVTLQGGDHSEAFRTGPLAEQTSQNSLDFFDLALKGHDDALDALAQVPGAEVVA